MRESSGTYVEHRCIRLTYGYIQVTYEYIRVTYIRIHTRFSTDVADIHEIKLLQYRDVFSSGIDHTSNTRILIRVHTN